MIFKQIFNIICKTSTTPTYIPLFLPVHTIQEAMFDNLRIQINLYQVLRDFEIISYTIDFLREIKI